MSDLEHDEQRLAEIVRLHPERDLEDEDALYRKKPRESWCAHHKVAFDEELHRVTCRACDREVDPFKVLVRLADDWERYVTHRKEAKRRADAAQERLQELLRLERNARARLKRIDPELERQSPQKPWGEGSAA